PAPLRPRRARGPPVTDPLLVRADRLGSGHVPVTIVPDAATLSRHMADAILAECAASGRPTVIILPVGPVGQYDLIADRCNAERISLRNLVLIGMDEYLGPDGGRIPEDDPLSFRGHVRRHLWDRLDPEPAPPPEHRVFPHPDRPD